MFLHCVSRSQLYQVRAHPNFKSVAYIALDRVSNYTESLSWTIVMLIRSDAYVMYTHDYLTSWFAYNTHFLFLFCCKASLYFCSYLQEKNSCPSFDYLTPLLLTCAEESLYYDEVAMLFTRLQTECKDFLACLKQQKAPLENHYPPGWVLPQHSEFVISREELFFIFIFTVQWLETSFHCMSICYSVCNFSYYVQYV